MGVRAHDRRRAAAALFAGVVAAGAAGNCWHHCNASCCGFSDPANECGGCDAWSECWPGAECFAKDDASRGPPQPPPPVIIDWIRQGASPHNCTVHTCMWAADAPAAGRGDGEVLGAQWVAPSVLPQRSPPGSARFYREAMRPKRPYVSRRAAPVASVWTDDVAMGRAASAWTVTVETQNRVVDSFRRPFHADWTLADFLRRYVERDGLYLITPVSGSRGRTPNAAGLLSAFPRHRELECPELAAAITARRVWMSQGNTSCSVHFDTHDAFIFQAAGTRRVLLWPPEHARRLYMDEGEHERYGLSPLNVDRVDMRRFAALRRAVPHAVTLEPGDALYVPSYYWHQITTPPGRNVMLSTELEFVQQMDQVTHTVNGERRRSNSSVLIEAARRQRTETRPAELTCALPETCRHTAATDAAHACMHAHAP